MNLEDKMKQIINKLKKETQTNHVYKMMKYLGGTDWKIAPLIKLSLKTATEMKNLEQIYISTYRDDLLNINRCYCMESIHELLLSFPASYLPIKAQRYIKINKLK